MSGSKRIEWLDYMKGVAILIVVVGHLSMRIGGEWIFTKPIVIGEMPLFFMLSGILANKVSKRSILESCKKKISSLGIPLIVVGTMYAICTGTLYWFIFDLYHMGYWFLLSLLSCWLMFIPLLKGIRYIFWGGQNTIVAKLGDFLLFMPFLIYKLLNDYIPTEVEEALSLNFTFTYYRFFVVGYFLGLYYSKLKSPYVLGLCVLMTIAMIWLILINSQVLIYIPMTIQQLILSVCLAGTIYECYKRSHKIIRVPIGRYGKGSILIYLFHFIIVENMNLSFLQDCSELVAFSCTLLVAITMCELILCITFPLERNRYLRKFVLGRL